eukprot:4437397-Pleurochrysis_carterae.AAC.1
MEQNACSGNAVNNRSVCGHEGSLTAELLLKNLHVPAAKSDQVSGITRPQAKSCTRPGTNSLATASNQASGSSRSVSSGTMKRPIQHGAKLLKKASAGPSPSTPRLGQQPHDALASISKKHRQESNVLCGSRAAEPALDEAAAKRVLQARFGVASFRVGQWDAVSAALSGRDVCVFLPTGAGNTAAASSYACPYGLKWPPSA